MLGRVLGDDVHLSSHLAPALGTVEADRSQMHQVLMNLIANAREAMPAGGTLTIETRNQDDSPEILLEIRDTGHGMDEGTRRHLFEPFFTTKKGTKNTGLGLAIVFGIVSRSGGRIDVQSRLGEGTAVRIYLPRIQDSPKEPKVLVEEQPESGTGLVLVVEDREDVRALTCGMVEQLGYDPVGAASGEEAVRIAQRHQGTIRLLLTDVVMPGVNGRELVERLHQIYPEMKVVFMSGYTDQILTDTGKLGPSILYLQKPFTIIQLAEVLRRANGFPKE